MPLQRWQAGEIRAAKSSRNQPRLLRMVLSEESSLKPEGGFRSFAE